MYSSSSVGLLIPTLKSLKKFEQVQNIEETNKSERLNAILKYIFSSNSNIDTHYSYYGRTKLKVIFGIFLMSVKGKIRKRFLDKNSIYKIPSNETGSHRIVNIISQFLSVVFL